MTKLENDLYGSQLHFNADQRRIKRFTIRDQHLWSIKLNGLAMPIEFVQDINWTGACLRIKDAAAKNQDKAVKLEVFYRNDLLFDVHGQVRWTKEASSYLGLFLMGIEFVDPDERIKKLWKDRGIERLTKFSYTDSSRETKRSHPLDYLPRITPKIEDQIIKVGYGLLVLCSLIMFYYFLR